MKNVIRYLRTTKIDASIDSTIEKQKMYTSQWIEQNQAKLTGTFTEGNPKVPTEDLQNIKPKGK